MSLTVTPALDDIAAALAFPGIAVYFTEVPEDKMRAMTEGRWAPYLLLTYAGPEPVRTGRHLTGRGRHDAYRNLLSVEACAMTDVDARGLRDRVVNTLVGFIPTDCDALYPRGGGIYSRAASAVRPQTYVAAANFTFLNNMTWSD